MPKKNQKFCKFNLKQFFFLKMKLNLNKKNLEIPSRKILRFNIIKINFNLTNYKKDLKKVFKHLNFKSINHYE